MKFSLNFFTVLLIICSSCSSENNDNYPNPNQNVPNESGIRYVGSPSSFEMEISGGNDPVHYSYMGYDVFGDGSVVLIASRNKSYSFNGSVHTDGQI